MMRVKQTMLNKTVKTAAFSAALALAVLALIAGSVVSTVMALRANKARGEAESNG